jgi:RNA polymerase sigma-70 factor (ECF subfamily)
LHTFRREAAFTTWLHRVATNTVFMYLRKRRLPSISLDDLEQPRGGEVTVFEPGSEDAWLRSCADRLTLQSEMSRLPNGYRTVLSLHDLLGYRHPEIARKLRCSVGNSKSQLHKARLRLRRSLLREPDRIESAAA